MTKKKKITISIISIMCAIIIGLGSFFGIRAYIQNKFPFTVNDTLDDGQGKTARVVLLGGQSNAAGCSHSEYLEKNTSTDKFSEYKNGYDNVYINYFSTGQNVSNAFVKCAAGQGDYTSLFGPELGIAETLNKKYPDEQIFIIKYSWSGTALFDAWLSPSSTGKTGDLYKAFTGFVRSSMRYLESKDYNVKIEGMCWMQGESDSFSVENATNYKTHLSNFIEDIREDLSKYAADDGIAFIDATIANLPSFWVYGNLVNESKAEVEKLSPLNVLIDTNAEGLVTNNEPEGNVDMAHYDALSEIKLGHLFAEEISKFFN